MGNGCWLGSVAALYAWQVCLGGAASLLQSWQLLGSCWVVAGYALEGLALAFPRSFSGFVFEGLNFCDIQPLLRLFF